MSIRGVIYNVVVRLQTVDTTSSHHSGSARNSIKGDSSCGSSGEEDNNEKTNGAESRKSFEPPLSTFFIPNILIINPQFSSKFFVYYAKSDQK